MDEEPNDGVPALADYLVRCCTMMGASSSGSGGGGGGSGGCGEVSAEQAASALREALARPESAEALAKFTSGGEASSVLLVEDATLSGGECAFNRGGRAV